MGDRPDSAGGDGSARGGLGGLAAALENRIVLLFSAAALGIGGNLAIVSNNPDARADPWTGTQGRATLERVQTLEKDMHRVQQQQALDNQHRIDAVQGYSRIRALESNCIRNESRIDDLERRLDKLNGVP